MSGLFRNRVSVNKSNVRVNNYPYQRRGAKVYGPDRIGIVGFHDCGFVIAKSAEAFASWIQERCQNLHKNMGGSCTNLTDGLRKAVEVLRNTPTGVLRRIWLLTDGYPNRETGSIMLVVDEARRAYINVNTIGFGDEYDEGLLRRISQNTHNGKFIPVRTLRQLTEALVVGSNGKNDKKQSSPAV